MLDLSSATIRIVWYAIFFAAGFIAISLWSFWMVTHPKRIVGQVRPEQLNLPYEEVELKTDDGLKIAGWFFCPVRNTVSNGVQELGEERPVLIILHGYPADKGDMLFFARDFFGSFDVLLVDFRYFGGSEGSYTTLGANERLDLKSAVDFLEGKGYGKIGVMGFSLGGAVGLLTAEEDERINAIVSYAGFADLKILGHGAYKYLFVLKYPLVWLIERWASIFYGINIGEISPMKAAENLKIPVLIVHTQADNQIPIKHGYLLKEALKNDPVAEFYFPERGRHGELPPDFEERVIDFFERTL